VIIGFYGERGSGKDTACHGLKILGFKQLAFADPLRDGAKAIFGLTDAEMTDRVMKETPLERWPYLSPRQILITLGTEGLRDNFPGIWIERLKARAEGISKVCISDCRFADEAEAIQEQGGILVRIDNPNVEPSNSTHRSEIAWRDFTPDAVIVNDCKDANAFEFKVLSWYQDYCKLRD
jgi:hypothetical protein